MKDLYHATKKCDSRHCFPTSLMQSITVSMIRLINELDILVRNKDSAENEYCADSVADFTILDKITN